MNGRRTTILLLLAGCGGLVSASPAAEPDLRSEFSFFVGVDTCRRCHDPSSPGSGCSLESIPQHARAYDALGRPEAEQIAALCGVAERPTESRICLGCHATGADEGPRWTEKSFDITRGVQCEACHDAGSRHVTLHESPLSDVRLTRAENVKRSDRDISCEGCHVPRPSHREILLQGYRRPETDREYKTPVNLAASPDGGRLYVVNTNANSVSVVDTERRSVIAEIAVGRRPQDLAFDSTGLRLFVTSRFDGTLSVIDLRSLVVEQVVAVGNDPHGVIADQRGRRVYVLNSGQDSISVLDGATRVETKRLVTGDGPWSIAGSHAGDTLLLTNVRPEPGVFRSPVHSEISEVATDRGVIRRRFKVPDANMLRGIAYVAGTKIALFTLLRTKHLVPMTRLTQGWSICNGLGVVWPDGRVDQVLLDLPHDHFPDPTDVAVSPDGRRALVTSGGSDQVAVIDVDALLSMLREATAEERSEIFPNHLGKSSRFVLRRVPVGENPRAVGFAADGRHAYVANALADSITVLAAPSFSPVAEIALGGPEEMTQTRWGERLFHSADNAYGRQFACSSCHPDGHVNGLTLDLEPDGAGMSPVDNRSLRGILDTPPFKWEGTNPSLKRQCGARLAVFFTRLQPYEPQELDALVHYIATIESPPNPYRRPEGLTVSQRRGKAVFERTVSNHGQDLSAGLRCTTCHNNPYRTSRQRANVGTSMWFDGPAEFDVEDLYGEEAFGPFGTTNFLDPADRGKDFDAPHLIHVQASAPYLHNGSARTLEEIWTRFNLYNRHGLSNDLTRREFNDLIAYLKAM